MSENKQITSKSILLVAGALLIIVGALVILTLAWLSVPIGYWLFGAGSVALGLLLRKIAVTAPKHLNVAHAALSALGGALLFMDAVVLVRFIIVWASSGRFHFESLIWALALTLVQIVLSKVEDRITAPHSRTQKKRATRPQSSDPR